MIVRNSVFVSYCLLFVYFSLFLTSFDTFQSSSVIKLSHGVLENENNEIIHHNVHLRKLNQPFEWHSPGPGDEENGGENVKKESNETQESTKKTPSTCRNSVQGKIWISDDQGKNFDSLSILRKFV